MNPEQIEKKEFFKFAELKPTDIIWDFGCGIGRYKWPVKKVYATDINKGIAPTTDIDKFIAMCVLHYIPYEDKDIYIAMAHNQLAKGGKIVLIEPNPYNPFFYCLYFWRWLINSECPRRWHNEKYTLTRLELIALLANAGFKNIEIKKYAWLPSKFNLLWLNRILNKMPIIGIMNAFNWVKGTK